MSIATHVVDMQINKPNTAPITVGGATGLEAVELGAARIRVDDKKIINCHADLNQLVPFKYEWAWDKYITACANHCLSPYY